MLQFGLKQSLNVLLVISIYAFVVACLPQDTSTQTPDNGLVPAQIKVLEVDGDTIAAFNGEIAVTPEARARGLMFRESIPKDYGMLFPFDVSQIVSFWMKNTYVFLDIIFIDAEGRIVKIHKNAIPEETTQISSGQKVNTVLEIRGGLSDELGIHVGDTVYWAQ